MYAVVRTPPITWSLGSFHTFPVPPDYELTIKRAPDGLKLPLQFKVDYRVTKDGKPENCVASKENAAPAELVVVACQAVASERAHIVQDLNGLPVEAQRQ